ncbi:hypothetical protein LJC27_06740 [Christensenellaceae bacterium OttesenSCG-928-M15]|nr:hypothetical protein [Christensenellaceae bacterium OttesenSCG-928-M15]
MRSRVETRPHAARTAAPMCAGMAARISGAYLMNKGTKDATAVHKRHKLVRGSGRQVPVLVRRRMYVHGIPAMPAVRQRSSNDFVLQRRTNRRPRRPRFPKKPLPPDAERIRPM